MAAQKLTPTEVLSYLATRLEEAMDETADYNETYRQLQYTIKLRNALSDMRSIMMEADEYHPL